MRRTLLALLLSAAAPVAAQMPPMIPILRPADPAASPLGTGGGAGGAAAETWFRFAGNATVRNVTQATLTPVLPAPGKATGAAVIVALGGGFLRLSMDSEGWPVARWLADDGIAAFVLKYRLKPTPSDAAGFGRAAGEIFARPPQGADGQVAIATPDDAVEDGLTAMKLVRAR